MSTLDRLWTRIARFAKAVEGIDDPTGRYLFALEKRIDKLERDVDHVERQLRSRAGGDTQQQPFAEPHAAAEAFKANAPARRA